MVFEKVVNLIVGQLPVKAEENLAAVMKKQEVFQRQEQEDFWQKKWNRDHRGSMIFIGLLLLAAYLVGTVFDLDWMSLAAVLAAPVVAITLNNRRASYIEHHLYDDMLE